jgi:DnaK suppressor protein
MAKVKKKKTSVKAARPKPRLAKKPAQVLAKQKLKVAKPSKAAKTNGSAKAAKSILKRPPPKHLSAEMLRLRARLMQMLAELRNDIDHEVRGASERDLAHINDSSDMAADSADGDLSLRIAESETVEAGEIERAIEKIESGTYGSCEMCNRVIGADRLQFLPFATLCIKCKELAEIRKREDEDELGDLSEGAEDTENN